MSKIDQVIAYGTAEIGKPYVWGNEGPNSFDCSGLMQFIFSKIGVKLPRTAAQQQDAVAPVGTPRAGDLIFWGNPATHVGLYLGGNRFLAAPSAGKNVRISTVYGSPTYGRPAGLGVSGLLTDPVGFSQTAFGLPDLDEIAGRAKDLTTMGLVVLGGVALVGLGLWQATKGDG